jgi:hypothetical protein
MGRIIATGVSSATARKHEDSVDADSQKPVGDDGVFS